VSLLFTAVASFLHLEPKNATVLRGSEVHFNCSTDESWDVMTWLLGGRTILSISVVHGLMGKDDSVSTVNHSLLAVSVWELVLMNASFSPTVQELTCELLPPSRLGRSTADLFVQGMLPFVEHLKINKSICLSVYPSIHSFIHSSIQTSIHTYIHLSKKTHQTYHIKKTIYNNICSPFNGQVYL